MIENSNYCGWHKWCPTAEEWEAFEVEGKLPFELLENEYLLIYEDEKFTKLVNQFCYENGELRRVSYGSITISNTKQEDEIIDPDLLKNDSKSLKKAAKKPRKKKSETIFPRNPEQVILIDLLKDRTKPVKLTLGGFGSGKSMLMILAALEAINKGEFDRLIVVRNNVKVADSFDIGYLKGSLEDKMLPWLLNIQDIIGQTAFKVLMDNGTIVAEPMLYLRGRNFTRSIIFVDEAENNSLSHLKLILGRCAEGSEVWIAGDTQQRDLPIFEKSKGLETMIEKFKGNPLFGYVFLTKSERGPVARMADILDK